MKHLFLSTLAASTLAFTSVQAAETYEFDKTHTNIVWSASHLGFSDSTGSFSELSGYFIIDEAKPEQSYVEVTVETGSVFTGIEKFDKHLMSEDFFNTEEFPKATFKSTSIEKTGEKTAKVHGELTMLGVTKPLTLDATLNKIGSNPFNNKKTAGFSLKGTINRALYGINYALPGVPAEVDLMIEAEGVLKNGEANAEE